MVVVGRETGVGPTAHSARLRGGVRSSRIRPTLLDQRERLPRTGTAHRKRTSGIRRLVRKAYMLCVSGFPCKVYIDLNHRDSQI
jgi:hypothetical protein